MSYFEKKVVYLSYMEYGNKIKSAGFLKMEIYEKSCFLHMRISGMEGLAEKSYDILVRTSKEKEYGIGKIYLQKGIGEWNKKEEDIIPGTISNIIVKISEERTIEGKIFISDQKEERENKESVTQTRAAEKQETEKQETEKQETEKQETGGEIQESELRAESMAEVILNDKWEQLRRIYPVIHPYGDEREYISIQPKDFVIMTGDYQHLANNSFLLHGFYNYRHIILGKEGSSNSFFLGVPGVYYEREKMVAVMFGFEAFECNGGKAEAGKNGYYLRKVEI